MVDTGASRRAKLCQFSDVLVVLGSYSANFRVVYGFWG